MTANQRVKALRKSLGLTQTVFGKRIGIVQGHLTGIESGEKRITETTMKAICAIFGVSEEWLRYGKGKMFTKADGDKIYTILSIFNELTPQYQSYALGQIKELLVMQKKLNYTDF